VCTTLSYGPDSSTTTSTGSSVTSTSSSVASTVSSVTSTGSSGSKPSAFKPYYDNLL